MFRLILVLLILFALFSFVHAQSLSSRDTTVFLVKLDELIREIDVIEQELNFFQATEQKLTPVAGRVKSLATVRTKERDGESVKLTATIEWFDFQSHAIYSATQMDFQLMIRKKVESGRPLLHVTLSYIYPNVGAQVLGTYSMAFSELVSKNAGVPIELFSLAFRLFGSATNFGKFLYGGRGRDVP